MLKYDGQQKLFYNQSYFQNSEEMKRALLILILGIIFIAQATSDPSHLYEFKGDELEKFVKENYPKAEKAEEGMYYLIEEKGDGTKPKNGDYVVIDFEGKRLDGTLFDKTEEEPFVFQLGHRQVIKGWDKGIVLFPVGSKVKLFLAPEWAYNKVGAGKLVPPDTPVMFELDIRQILSEKEYDGYMAELEDRERERYHQKIKDQFDADKKAIHEYCMDNKIMAKRTRLGVSYQVTKKGKGVYPKPGDKVTVQYKGYLVGGEKFEETSDKEPFEFIVGQRRVIQGLDDAITSFNEGAQGTILIPSKLAYGPMPIEEEGVSIPAHSILIFKLKVLKVESPVRENK